MNSHVVNVQVAWNFEPEDIDHLPGNFTAGKAMSGAAMVPAKDDLVSFSGLPGVHFIVSHREFVYASDQQSPHLLLRVHLARLPRMST